MPVRLFESNALARQLGRAAPDGLVVHRQLAGRLVERLQDVKDRSFDAVLDASLDGGALAKALHEVFEAKAVALDWRTSGADYPAAWDVEEDGFDLVVSHLRLPVVNDVPYFLHQAHRALKPDGLLLASTLGLESFRELRQAFHAAGLGMDGHVIPLTDVREAGALLQRMKFALPVVDRDMVTLTFGSFEKLLAQLTAHGARNVSGLRPKGLLTPRQLRRVEQAHGEMFRRDDGRLPLTLEVVYLHGWKPADTQPKPLKPGAGRISLVKILGQN